MVFLAFLALNQALTDADNGIARTGINSIISQQLPPHSLRTLVSLVIINALAVNSITNERDGQALDLLLVTDISPAEFVFWETLGCLLCH